MKRLHVKDLWSQQVVRDYHVGITKVPRSQNVSDVLASKSGTGDFFRHLGEIGLLWPGCEAPGHTDVLEYKAPANVLQHSLEMLGPDASAHRAVERRPPLGW